MNEQTYGYWTCCVDFSGDVGALIDMIDDSITITRKTFMHHVDPQDRTDLELRLGYELYWKRGLTCAQDYHVTYHRSKFKGKRVYYMKHAAIEYIFRQ